MFRVHTVLENPEKPWNFFVLENLEKSWNFPKIVWNFKKVLENFHVHVDMYMYMYSDLPHVHGADRRGVRGYAATVLRPQAIIFRILHVMYMGVGAGIGTLVLIIFLGKLSWKSHGFFTTFSVRSLVHAVHKHLVS